MKTPPVCNKYVAEACEQFKDCCDNGNCRFPGSLNDLTYRVAAALQPFLPKAVDGMSEETRKIFEKNALDAAKVAIAAMGDRAICKDAPESRAISPNVPHQDVHKKPDNLNTSGEHAQGLNISELNTVTTGSVETSTANREPELTGEGHGRMAVGGSSGTLNGLRPTERAYITLLSLPLTNKWGALNRDILARLRDEIAAAWQWDAERVQAWGEKAAADNMIPSIFNIATRKEKTFFEKNPSLSSDHRSEITPILESDYQQTIDFLYQEIDKLQKKIFAMGEVHSKPAVVRPASPAKTNTSICCAICKKQLDNPDDKTSENCGGDCLECMADAGDSDCLKSMYKILKQQRREISGNEGHFGGKLHPVESKAYNKWIRNNHDNPLVTCNIGFETFLAGWQAAPKREPGALKDIDAETANGGKP